LRRGHTFLFLKTSVLKNDKSPLPAVATGICHFGKEKDMKGKK